MFWFSPFWYQPQIPQFLEPSQAEFLNSDASLNCRLKVQSTEGLDSNESKNETFQQLLKAQLVKSEGRNFRKNWSEEQDQNLLLMKQNGLCWDEISNKIEGTNAFKCMRRYERLVKREQKWPKQVDQQIIELKEKKGINWIQIRAQLNKMLPLRLYSTKEIRLRYENYLKIDSHFNNWSFDQDLKLIELVKKYKRKWKKITSYFPYHTQLQVKNRFCRTLEPIIKRVSKEIKKSSKLSH